MLQENIRSFHIRQAVVTKKSLLEQYLQVIEGIEVLWADLRPSHLPRGFSNNIVGVIYQYPDADDTAMKEYLISSLVSLEASYPNCAFVLAGDFNRTFLPMAQSAVKSASTIGPGRGGTSYLTDFHETWPVPRVPPKTTSV